MKIIDILNNKRPSLSFEIFPPKQSANTDNVLNVATALADLRPDFISVTCGAGGSGNNNNTSLIAGYIQKSTTALAHLTCVSSSREQVKSIANDLIELDVENILALRGDMPEDGVLSGDYRYAADLASELKSFGFCVGGACYPEGHPEAETRETDIEHIKLKVESGCDFLTTQLFFDNNILYNFMYLLQSKGVDAPVIAGIMPITNAKQIKKMTTMCGAALTPKHKAIIDKFGHNTSALRQAGIAYATEQIVDLVANGVRGIHLYTMNKPDIARDIYNNVSEMLS
jgi:methylenetetrahydrofolate reductase (NADPH)